MNIIHWILNLTALLLWLKWRERPLLNGRLATTVSLAASLRSVTGATTRFLWPAILLGLLLLRWLLYWQLGAPMKWIPRLSCGVVVFQFRSDSWERMFLFSFLSFGALLGFYYLSLLFFSLLNHRVLESDPMQRSLRAQLGLCERLPLALKWLLPFLAGLGGWMLLHYPLLWMGLVAPGKAFWYVPVQGLVAGLYAYSLWQYVTAALLVVYLLDSYIYFGTWPVWSFAHHSGQRLLKVLDFIPLRTGKIDFAPVVLLALILGLGQLANWVIYYLSQKVPF